MSKNLFIPIIASFIVIGSFSLNGQKLQLEEVELPTSKEAHKKGVYVNTSLTPEGNIRTYVAYDLKKEGLGFDVMSIAPDGKLIESSSEVASSETQEKYGIEIPKPGKVKNPAGGVKVLRLASATGILGKLKIEEGYFEPRYKTSKEYGAYVITYTPVLKGFKFASTQKTESEMKLNVYASHYKPGDNLQNTYNIIEGLVPNTIGYFNKSAIITFMGKDARFDKNSPNASNVVITGQFDGNTNSFLNIKEHVMSYNLNKVSSGYDGRGNRSVLLSTLNAPSSIQAWKKWQANGKPYMSYMTFNTDGDVVDNVTFESKSVRGNFATFGFDDSHYILGSINADHEKYFRADVGSPTDFQIVKIENGEVVKKMSVSKDQLESLLVTPGGKKGKLKYKDLRFVKCVKEPNGDLMAFTTGSNGYMIFQFDQDLNMKAVYHIPANDVGGSLIQHLESNGKFYVLFRGQTPEIAMGIKLRVSRGHGYMKNTNFSRVDEVMSYARIVKIDPGSQSCSETLDIVDDVIMGTETIFKGSDGELILPLRDKKKNYKMALIK